MSIVVLPSQQTVRPLPGTIAVLLALSGCACQTTTHQPRGDRFMRGERIAAHVKFLSSDSLEGRGVATRGEVLATEYIATQFALAGLQPVGDGGTYFQKVSLVGVESLPETKLSWVRQGPAITMKLLDDFVAVNRRQRTDEAVNAEVVFVGHGISAPEYEWDDYKGVDVKGKVVLLFTNEPPSDDPDFFAGKALTYYGRWTFKYEEALRRGALGAIIIHTPDTAGYPWEVVRNSWGHANPYVRLQPGEPALAVAAWVTAEVGEQLVASTGRNLVELLELANSSDFRPIALGLRLQGRIASRITTLNTHNVLGIVEGSDPDRKSEAVLYTAHWDHLGMGVSVEGDDIYNGAVDNATGCGVIVELAGAFAQLTPPPPRSIIFAAVTAEEGGLRGSEFYARHPVVPAGMTAVNLNFDGLLPLGPSQDVTLPGYDRTTIKRLVERTADKLGLFILPEAHPEQGYYYRSDHFSLAKAGVPAFSLRLTGDSLGRSPGSGKKAREAYVANHYHQPSDEFDPSWDFSGLEQLARFGFEIGRRVAELPSLPTWNPGDEFLAAREKSWGNEE